MKHAVVTGLSHWPTGGPAEYGLPANWGTEGYCINRWQQDRLPFQVPSLGRKLSVPTEAKALQLRPDGYQSAREVYLIFRPREVHEHTYGPQPVRCRAGEIVPVPWSASSSQRFNGDVEVYPTTMAFASYGLADAHYARFAILECCNRHDAISYQPPEHAIFFQQDELTLGDPWHVNPAVPADASAVPGLRGVPCTSMKWGLIEAARPAYTGLVPANSERDVTNGYFIAVYAIGRQLSIDAVLPIAYIRPVASAYQKQQYESYSFPIPPTADAIKVFAWRHTRTFDLTAQSIILHLSATSDIANCHKNREARHEYTVRDGAVEFRPLAAISRPIGLARNSIYWQIYADDVGVNGAAGFLRIYTSAWANDHRWLNNPEIGWWERTIGLGNVGSGASIRGTYNDPWDCAVLCADCQALGQSVDVVAGQLYTAPY